MKLLRMGMDGTCFCGFVPPTMKQFSFLTLLEVWDQCNTVSSACNQLGFKNSVSRILRLQIYLKRYKILRHAVKMSVQTESAMGKSICRSDIGI